MSPTSETSGTSRPGPSILEAPQPLPYAVAAAALLGAWVLVLVVFSVRLQAMYTLEDYPLRWGQAFAALHPDLQCRLATPGERTFIELHGPERAPLSVERMAQEFGWRARFGCADSAVDLSQWWVQHRKDMA